MIDFAAINERIRKLGGVTIWNKGNYNDPPPPDAIYCGRPQRQMRETLFVALVLVLNTLSFGQYIDKIARPPISSSTIPHLNYYGGPVVSNAQVIAVLWGPDVFPEVVSGISSFYQNVTISDYYNLLSEYSTTSQVIGAGTFGGLYEIIPSVCNVSPCTISDDQVQAELLAQITSGQLPAPILDAGGNLNTVYMLHFPPGVTIVVQGFSSCVSYCAYHNSTTTQFNSKNIDYGVIPDFSPPKGCESLCGSGTAYQNLTSISTHELAEIVTDIDGPIAPNSTSYPTAWMDPIFGRGEIGDICDREDAFVSVPGGYAFVQKLWSNSQNACVAPGTILVIVPSPLSLTYATPKRVGTVTFPKIVRMRNPTKAIVTFTSVNVEGANAGDFTITANSCVGNLLGAKACSTSIVFRPTAIGNRTAQLIFVDSSVNSPQIVPLSGTGK